MSVIVVDASALGAILFGEPEAERMADLLSVAPLLAPALLPFELANICLKKIRAHPHKEALIMRAFEQLHGVAIDYVEVEHPGVVTLANETGLTTYDASYLWLARETGGRLVTLDAQLLEVIRNAE